MGRAMDYQNSSWDCNVLEGQLLKNLTKYSFFLQKLSTASQVDKLSQLIKREQIEQLQSLENFIQNSQAKHNSSIRRLELQRADLTSTLSHYHATLSTISDSNVIAKTINNDIMTIDREDKLINKTLQFVSQTKILKQNISIINSALESKNYMLAAKSIQEIRSLPREIIESEFAKKTVPSSEIPEEPSILLDNWCKQFTSLLRTNFLEAAKSQDVQQLTMMFKMFPMVGQKNLGLDVYSKYVCDIIAEESRKIMTSEAKKNGVFGQALFHLFGIVSTIINDHSKVISSCYGTTYMIHVMEKVEKEADLQGGLVLDMFTESRKIERIVKEINEWFKTREYQYNNRTNDDANNADDNDDEYDSGDSANENEKDGSISIIGSNDLSSLVNEFSEMLKTWSMYARFFSVRWYEFSDVNDMESLVPPPPILESQFALKLQKENILTNFETLLLYSLNKSFTKSLSLEELPSLNDLISLKPVKHNDLSSYPISSILEDFSLLIRENLILSVNTGQIQVFSHFLDQLAKFYQNEFLVRFMQSKFKFLQTKLTSSSSLKKYVPTVNGQSNPNSNVNSRAISPTVAESYASTKLSQLGFNFRGAAANALTNIQTNLQSVVSDEESVLSLHHFLIYANTLSLSTSFVHRLLTIEILEENPKLLHDNFPFSDNALQLTSKVKACEELICKQTSRLQTWLVKFLFENNVMKKVRAMTTNILVNGNENCYVSGADDFESLSSMNEFVAKWKSMMIPFQNVLYEDVYTGLLTLVVDYIVKILEQRIWALKVNELGATKLDRELSLLIKTVCALNYTLREKFTKLTQIVLILGFDDDNFDVSTADIKEEIVSSMKWVLSPQERIAARALKVDKRH